MARQWGGWFVPSRFSVENTITELLLFSLALAFLLPLIYSPARRVKAVDEGESLRCWPPPFATVYPLLWVRVQGWGWEQMDHPETYPSFVMQHGARCNPSFCEFLPPSPLSLSPWDSLRTHKTLNKILQGRLVGTRGKLALCSLFVYLWRKKQWKVTIKYLFYNIGIFP